MGVMIWGGQAITTNSEALPAMDEVILYPHVQEILRDAAAGAPKNTLLGDFWELPPAEFLALELGGEQLVAPKAAGSCCGGGASSGGLRSERSLLIKGLQGSVPFDGSQYPRIPWGGKAVSAQDIALIAQWIDAGCPAELVSSAGLAADTEVLADSTLTVVGPAGPVFAPTTDPDGYRHSKGELRQRMEVDALGEHQIERLRLAFRELYKLNKWPGDKRSYNNLALIHQNHCQHGWERFLPWHRIYLYEFEQALQDFCPDVTMPWWEFTAPAYTPDDPIKGEVIPRSFKAFLTEASLRDLAEHGFPTNKMEALVGQLFTAPSLVFDAVTKATGDASWVEGDNRKRLIDALLAANALWYPLRYPGQFGTGTIDSVIHYHYPTAQDIDQIMSLRTFRDFGGGSLYDDSFGFIDQNPHNTMHIWTGGMNPAYDKDAAPANLGEDRSRAVRVSGRNFHSRDDLYSEPQFGDMFSNLTAAFDPVFWPIHSNIDRLWWKWQQAHPDGVPADLDGPMSPWSYATRDTLDMRRFGYEYVRGGSMIPVGLGQPVGRFVSTPIEIAESVKSRFSSAEVRLHRVPQLLRSCFIRVFLNVPDADASTPLTHEGYAGYLAVFGHGECYGGPGHCELPPDEPRKFDRRDRHMNTPRNHRIDVTLAARRLIAKGARSLTVTLVVVGASYAEDRELLRLDGVSLNFLD
jgi:tyrosinase